MRSLWSILLAMHCPINCLAVHHLLVYSDGQPAKILTFQYKSIVHYNHPVKPFHKSIVVAFVWVHTGEEQNLTRSAESPLSYLCKSWIIPKDSIWKCSKRMVDQYPSMDCGPLIEYFDKFCFSTFFSCPIYCSHLIWHFRRRTLVETAATKCILWQPLTLLAAGYSQLVGRQQIILWIIIMDRHLKGQHCWAMIVLLSMERDCMWRRDRCWSSSAEKDDKSQGVVSWITLDIIYSENYFIHNNHSRSGR